MSAATSLTDSLSTARHIVNGNPQNRIRVENSRPFREEALKGRLFPEGDFTLTRLKQERCQAFDKYSQREVEIAVYGLLIPRCEENKVSLSNYGNHAGVNSVYSIEDYQKRKKDKTLFDLRKIQQVFSILKPRLQKSDVYEVKCEKLRKEIRELSNEGDFLDGYLIAAALFNGHRVRFKKKYEPMQVTCEFRVTICHLDQSNYSLDSGCVLENEESGCIPKEDLDGSSQILRRTQSSICYNEDISTSKESLINNGFEDDPKEHAHRERSASFPQAKEFLSKISVDNLMKTFELTKTTTPIDNGDSLKNNSAQEFIIDSEEASLDASMESLYKESRKT